MKTRMTNLLRRLVVVCLCMFCFTGAKADGEIYYGIYQGTGTLSNFGTKKVETYDIALHLTDPDLVGLEVRGIRIPVNTSAANVHGYKVWLSKELTLVSGKMTPDVVSMDVTPDGKWTDIRLAEPYTIEEGGIYAGYSLTVDSLDKNSSNDPNETPIVTIATENPEGLLIHTSRTHRKWVGLADVGSPAIGVLIGGERVKSYAATFSVSNNLYTTTGKSIATTLTLINHGTEAIKNLDYEIELGGKVVAKHVTMSLSGGYYGRSTTLSVTIPAMTEAGVYDTKFRITKINGVANEDPKAEVVAPVVFLTEMPVHKPLVEEYTGTWCQYCPSYLAGMEKMNDSNGDDFVGVAYHSMDEMQFATSIYYPANPSGLPACFIDRLEGFAPLNGQAAWEARRNVIAPANISVVGEWTDESKTKIKATSTTTFIRDFTDSPYLIGYILIANDMHDAKWAQSNAYSGGSTTGDPYFDKYIKAGNPIRDLHYDEVALAQSESYGAGVAESLPRDLKGNTPYTHSFTFDISECTLPIDKEKLEVIAVLLDTTTGGSVNCNKGHVTVETGMLPVVEKRTSQSPYYDLSGRPVSPAKHGLYIQNGKKIIK